MDYQKCVELVHERIKELNTKHKKALLLGRTDEAHALESLMEINLKFIGIEKDNHLRYIRELTNV